MSRCAYICIPWVCSNYMMKSHRKDDIFLSYFLMDFDWSGLRSLLIIAVLVSWWYIILVCPCIPWVMFKLHDEIPWEGCYFPHFVLDGFLLVRVAIIIDIGI